MSADGEKPVLLREACERCSKPIFPTRPGSTASILHRPGFCNCAIQDALRRKGASGGSNQNPQPDNSEAGAEPKSEDPGFKLKFPSQKGPDLEFGSPDAGPQAKAGGTADKNAQAAKSDRPPGTKFDPAVQLQDLIAEGYTFFDRIGKGTMGYVYQAKSEHMESLLAVKIFHRAPFKNKRTLKRLEQEASAALNVSHPHLASVYKFGVSEKEYPYIVMDFIAGPSLAEVLAQEGFLDTPRALDLFIQIAEALEFAHGENLLHRGLKPSNIYVLVTTGGGDFVKVADFGIAKVLPNPGRETKYMTPMGEEFGNPNYMSPEQCLGNRLDQRSDIYSFGCVMYECMSGKVPHGSSNAMRVAFKQVSEEAKSLVERFNDLDIPKDLDDVILACLQKNPDDRYNNVKELRLALEAIRSGKKPKMPTKAFSAIATKNDAGKIIDKVIKLIKSNKPGAKPDAKTPPKKN
ncbi:MAG: serine/threonine protein kinase [Cyanobacteria bacterium SZAS LIN-2]|nr:serine/threonine protein kinase [Cyanobacteria bacterium SZAS LIN-2]